MNLADRLRNLSSAELVRRMVLGAILDEPPCRRVIPGFRPRPDPLTRDEGDSPTLAPSTPRREDR